MTFKQMNISEPVCRALLEKNYSTPTLIQEQAIPEALTGRDLLGLAQTGTGKTADKRKRYDAFRIRSPGNGKRLAGGN